MVEDLGHVVSVPRTLLPFLFQQPLSRLPGPKHEDHLFHLSAALRKWRERNYHPFLLAWIMLFLDEWLWSETWASLNNHQDLSFVLQHSLLLLTLAQIVFHFQNWMTVFQFHTSFDTFICSGIFSIIFGNGLCLVFLRRFGTSQRHLEVVYQALQCSGELDLWRPGFESLLCPFWLQNL